MRDECVMNDLVGRKVLALLLSEDQSLMVVVHDGGFSAYKAQGDCCSETWFADIVGVSRLLGHVVVKASDVELGRVEDGRSRQDTDDFYGIKLTTDAGFVDIVYRNSSNGYYGGWLERFEGRIDEKMIRVWDDYSA